MLKHQDEYLELLDEKFRVVGKPRSYLHKFTTELDSFHLPTCVWLTRWSDKELEVDMEIGFFI